MSDFTKDIDVLETQEWLEAFEDVIKREGADRAKFLFEQLLAKGSELGIKVLTQLLKLRTMSTL